MDILDYSTYKAYYGAAFESVLRFNTPAGVKNVTVATPEDGEATYYNLQGVRVANPENGLYIRVQNGKATKQVIK
jgi:hypothetical protein